MISPRLFDIPTFDATEAMAVQFEWTGAQIFGNKLTIKENDSGTVVYPNGNQSGIYEYMGKSHVIPAGTLTNGVCYNATVEVLDSNLQKISSSDVSNTVIFYCYSKPEFAVSSEGLTNGQCPISNFTAIVTYTQDEDDILSQYQIVLYDGNKAVIYNPGVKYLTEPTSSVSQAFSGLENNGNYFIRATGKTAHDVFVDSDFFGFGVRYENPEIFSRLDLVNNRRDGNISITSNLISIIGVLDGDGEPIYIDNKMVDLRDGKVTFADGYRFKENWTIGASLCAITPNIPLITWEDENGKEARIVYREDVFDINNDVLKGYFELIVDGPSDRRGFRNVAKILVAGTGIAKEEILDGTKTLNDYEAATLAVDSVIPRENYNDAVAYASSVGIDGTEFLVDPYWHIIIDSNFIDPIESDEDKYTLWIVKRDGLYSLSAIQEEDVDLGEG